MKKNLTTEAGPTERRAQDAQVDALNQVFALFKRNYHNQFFKAFASESDLIAVKRLWLDALSQYSGEVICEAAMAVVKTSEFLPTLKTMLDQCERVSEAGLPDVHSAYTEACCAASPKAAQAWSHPAVYHAGRECGWHFLQSNPEQVAFPVFRNHYQRLAELVRAGEVLKLPDTPRIEAQKHTPASRETSEKYLDSLKSLLD